MQPQNTTISLGYLWFKHFEDDGKLAGSLILELFISFQRLRLKIRERKGCSNTIFFPNIEITGLKDYLSVSFCFFIFATRSFELLEIYNEKSSQLRARHLRLL